MTTTKNTKPRTTGTVKSRSSQIRRKRLDAQADYFDEHFDADLRTAQSLTEHITPEEFCYLVGRCGLKKHFTPALLRVLGRANRRREERLKKMLDNELAILLEGYEPSVAEPLAARIRQRSDRYDGPLEVAPLVNWILEEAQLYVWAEQAAQNKNTDYVQNARDFLILHSTGRDALLGGIRRGLASCLDLGADLGDKEQPGDTVRELEQRAWLKIWQNLSKWTADGTASISTRLFGFGVWEARAWKTERLRDRERMVRGMFDRREDEDERQAA